jgi:hypothetical protein
MIEIFLTTEDLANRLKLQPATLRYWRHKGKGPRYLKLGQGSAAHVRYGLSDVIKWEHGIGANLRD